MAVQPIHVLDDTDPDGTPCWYGAARDDATGVVYDFDDLPRLAYNLCSDLHLDPGVWTDLIVSVLKGES